MLVAAIATRRYDVLAEATRDRIHQPYRLELVPGAAEALAAAVPAGAVCSFLSGSGSTLAALVEPGRGPAVSAAMRTVLERAGTGAETLTLPVDGRGAEVVAETHDGETWSWTWGTP
jgi:homoserine kinase